MIYAKYISIWLFTYLGSVAVYRHFVGREVHWNDIAVGVLLGLWLVNLIQKCEQERQAKKYRERISGHENGIWITMDEDCKIDGVKVAKGDKIWFVQSIDGGGK